MLALAPRERGARGVGWAEEERWNGLPHMREGNQVRLRWGWGAHAWDGAGAELGREASEADHWIVER